MPQVPPPSRTNLRAASLLVAAATLAVMIATEPRLAMVWDEGYTLGREARVRAWFQALRDPLLFAQTWEPPSALEGLVDDKLPPPTASEVDSRAKLLSGRVLAWFWPFAREEPHGHPPFYAIVGVIGDWLAPSWAELPRSRLGPMLVFSLAAGAIFGTFLRRGGPWAASAAAGAWVLNPHLFALGHYAGYDAILSALWVGAILAFCRAVRDESDRRWPWVVTFGVLVGLALDTKLTGWFLPLPFLAWAVLTRNRRGLRTLLIGGLVALATLYIFNPPWWLNPIGGPIAFFRSNLSRAKTIPIQVMFLGTVYRTPAESLPFYNTIAWTIMAAPIGFLILALVGSLLGCRSYQASSRPGSGSTIRDPLPVLALSHWLFLLTLRALPHAPGHDGVRQFLPAFGCLALMVGVGATFAIERWRVWGKGLVAVALIEGAASVALFMPTPLSYFSPIVGGLPGAAKLGMEPTYYWDALSNDALDQLAKATPRGRSVFFKTFPTSWLHLKNTGAIRFDLAQVDRTPPAWYVVQNRPGEFSEIDRRLIRAPGAKHVLVEKFGVPLVWSFPYDEVEAALKATAPAPARGSP